MLTLAELKRRNVIKVAIAYAIVAWLLIEIASTVFPILHLPEWTVTLVTVLLMLGFPVALFFAWAYELTPAGLQRDDGAPVHRYARGRKLDFIIIFLLLGAVGYLALETSVGEGLRVLEVVD